MPLSELTPEEFAEAEAWDPEQAHREMNNLELEAMEGWSEVEKALRVAGGRHRAVVLENGKDRVTIRTRAAIPYGLRVRIARFYQRQQEGGALGDPDAEVGELYELMALLCLDTPWTNPQSWAHLDKMTGDTPKLFDQAVLEINGFAEMVEKFRGR